MLSFAKHCILLNSPPGGNIYEMLQELDMPSVKTPQCDQATHQQRFCRLDPRPTYVPAALLLFSSPGGPSAPMFPYPASRH